MSQNEAEEDIFVLSLISSSLRCIVY